MVLTVLIFVLGVYPQPILSRLKTKDTRIVESSR
jgi:NADH:ubiquinone oxidoreductase subunit 4 (subunit M)